MAVRLAVLNQRRHSGARRPSVIIAAALCTAAMLVFFAALGFAYLARPRGALNAPKIPELFLITSVILLVSSAALQWSHAALRAHRLHRALLGLGIALALGVLFLLGQAMAWAQLLGSGVNLRVWPQSRFLFLFVAAHAIHLTVGLALLGYLFSLGWRGRLQADRRNLFSAVSIFWHGLDASWVLLLAILWTGR